MKAKQLTKEEKIEINVHNVFTSIECAKNDYYYLDDDLDKGGQLEVLLDQIKHYEELIQEAIDIWYGEKK